MCNLKWITFGPGLGQRFNHLFKKNEIVEINYKIYKEDSMYFICGIETLKMYIINSTKNL